jgi:hypothetical protein
VVVLSGTWKLKWVTNPFEIPVGFEAPGFDVGHELKPIAREPTEKSRPRPSNTQQM